MDNIDKVLSFKPTSESDLSSLNIVKLLKRYFSPSYSGMENINPDKPTLFVGNHTRFGFFDSPLIIREIHSRTGMFPRSLTDKAHVNIPVWSDFLYKNGSVLGSREICTALMQAGESIIVFPGGAKEVVKGKGLDYQLMWRERLGFVRMAVENGYSITPFSSVGAEEALSVIMDGKDIMNSFAGKLIKAAGLEDRVRGGDLIMPLARGIGLSMMPRPERFYFSIGKPIETEKYKGKQEDKALLKRIQIKTAASINTMIKDDMLKRAREKHDQSLIRSLLQRS